MRPTHTAVSLAPLDPLLVRSSCACTCCQTGRRTAKLPLESLPFTKHLSIPEEYLVPFARSRRGPSVESAANERLLAVARSGTDFAELPVSASRVNRLATQFRGPSGRT